jgi:DNA-binding NarL/FixJ family response regulator
MPIGVVLADDHPVVIDGLCRYFAQQKDILVRATAKSRKELDAAIAAEKPQVVIVDLNMEGMAGAETIEVLVRLAPVIVFSMQDEDGYAASLVRLGAAAFLNKSRQPEELASAIRAAAKGERYLTDRIAERLSHRTPGAAHESFSGREREVFERLLDGQTPKEIAFALGLSASTVHTYAERIRAKLGVEGTEGLVSYAFRHGLRR